MKIDEYHYEITKKEWAEIHNDYKNIDADGCRWCFAGCIRHKAKNDTGTTLVKVKVV